MTNLLLMLQQQKYILWTRNQQNVQILLNCFHGFCFIL